MLESVNRRFMGERRRKTDNDFILEAALDVEEVIPGSDDEVNDIVDPDSVPDDVYKKIDKALDDIIDKDDYDDADAAELVDDDVDDDDESDSIVIDDIITEQAGAWLDCEDMGHPDQDRGDGCDDLEQPEYDAEGSVIDGGGESMTESIRQLRNLTRG